jgi:hypothetical protein
MKKNAAAITKATSADVKLTRSELVDIIVHEMQSEAKKEETRIVDKIKEINASFTVEDVMPLLRGKSFSFGSYSLEGPTRFELFVGRDENDDGETVTVTVDDPVLGDRLAKLAELKEQLQEVKEKQYKMMSNQRDIKMEVLKRMLEGSEDGRSILDQISKIKVNLNKSFFTAKK